MVINIVERHTLSESERTRVEALATACEHADGAAPFNEVSLFAIAAQQPGSAIITLALAPPSGPAAAAGRGSSDGDGEVDAEDEIVGVAVSPDAAGSAIDLAVHPDNRRRGIGTKLLAETLNRYPEGAWWAHGAGTAAKHLAQHHHLEAARDLWVMARATSADDTFDTALPPGFTARAYDGSEDQAKAWVALNSRAFASHPEQGRMTLADFQARAREPWFDPAGLILIWDTSQAEPSLAAFHWTKKEPHSTVGEVYVVAVAPQYQGRGLARGVTGLGLAHLAAQGCETIELYVEGDNEPAKATYARAGFTRAAHDVMYVAKTGTSPDTIES